MIIGSRSSFGTELADLWHDHALHLLANADLVVIALGNCINLSSEYILFTHHKFNTAVLFHHHILLSCWVGRCQEGRLAVGVVWLWRQLTYGVHSLLFILTRAEVRMCECLFSTDSVLGVFGQHLDHQVECIRVYSLVLLLIEIEVTGSILSKHLIVSLSWKGTNSHHEHVKDKSQTKHITNWMILSLHIFDVYHLWCNISWSTTPHKKILISIRKLC